MTVSILKLMENKRSWAKSEATFSSRGEYPCQDENIHNRGMIVSL